MNIIEATNQQLHDLIPLFDGYRQFYRQQSDFVGAKKFLEERLKLEDSIIFIAYEEENAIGFTQLFPLFSSVTMQRMYLLNDLYVEDNYRGKGIGKALIDRAKELCKVQKYKGLVLQTEVTNPAQKLYEKLGFVKDPDLHYFWKNAI